MKLLFRREALADLDRIHAWIGSANRSAADALVETILSRVRGLARPGMAGMGRPGRAPGTRELIIPPHIVVYEVDERAAQIVILAVYDGRQDRR